MSATPLRDDSTLALNTIDELARTRLAGKALTQDEVMEHAKKAA
jgi:hypothetical protein